MNIKKTNKYYIEGANKSEFYLLGTLYTTLTEQTFKKGRGWEFIRDFFSDFPHLLEQINIIDENDNIIPTDKFMNHILKLKTHDIN